MTMRQSFGGIVGQRVDAAGEIARAGADADGAAAAEQRHGHGFVDQARRLGGELVAVEPHQRKGIVGVVDRGRHQRVGALAHEAGVGAIEQDDRAARIGPGEEGVDFFSAKRDHPVLRSSSLERSDSELHGARRRNDAAQVPATK